MEIVETTQLSQIRLREEFLAPYRRKGDPFESLLARSTYLTKYCRGNTETWTDTIRRVVEGNVNLAPGVTEYEAQLLFHLFWTGQALPPGRGLWTGGVEGIPADARYNCYYVTLRSLDDWVWTANQLMLGGGVGVGLGCLQRLSVVADNKARFAIWCRENHPDIADVKPEGPQFLNGVTPKYVTEDSRGGWVIALRKVLDSAFSGTDLVVDVSDVRPRGSLIKTFGGIACGPGPLASLLRAVWNIVRGAVGRRLNSVEALDITNHIGLCIKSGNVRRSALIILGQASDQSFRDAKKDWEAVASHRHTSNNSIAFDSWEQLGNFDWAGLVEDNIRYGEPGVVNMPLAWKTDPEAKGINPCFAAGTLIAVADGRNSVPIEQLAQEGRDVPVYSMNKATGLVEIKMGRHPRVTGYHKRLVRVWLDDGGYLDTTPDHEFVLRDGTTVKASGLKLGMSLPRFTKALERVKKGSKDYYLIHCDTRHYHGHRVFEHRLIAKFYFPDEWARVKSDCRQNGLVNTGGLVVHHEDYDQLNNSPGNLRIMTFKEHAKLHGTIDQAGEKNGRWSGISNEQLREHALRLTGCLGRRFSANDWNIYAQEHSLPRQFSLFRVQALGTITGLAKACAAELGFTHTDEDPRVVKTYQAMLAQGYDAQVFEGQVFVSKICEMCGEAFQVEHTYRERSFCSETCGNAHINSDLGVKSRRVAGLDAVYSRHMATVKVEQARVYSDLKFDLGRAPNRKEWSLACKGGGFPSRIGPTLKHGYRSFQEVATAGDGYNHRVVRVEDLPGEHTVYNITVDHFHTVGVISSTQEKCGKVSYTGVYVANCGEVILHDREACNLAEVFPAKFDPSTDPVTVLQLVTRYSLRQRLSPMTDPEADYVRQKNMRVGVGLGGICDFEWTPEQLADWYGVVRHTADSYADELKVSRPIAVTTTKPSGTISLLNGSSPGIHTPHSEYYIRRTRIAKNDPMAEAMMRARVPYEEDIYDQTNRTWVFSFPMKAKNAKVTSKTESLRSQFERQATVQEWWADNAVSATLNFDPKTEREELAACLREFVPRLKSTSCLPKTHGYAQPPYEAVDCETYSKMSCLINHEDPLVNGGDIEVEECSGGVCPLR